MCSTARSNDASCGATSASTRAPRSALSGSARPGRRRPRRHRTSAFDCGRVIRVELRLDRTPFDHLRTGQAEPGGRDERDTVGGAGEHRGAAEHVAHANRQRRARPPRAGRAAPRARASASSGGICLVEAHAAGRAEQRPQPDVRRARTKRLRSARAWLAPALPPRKRSSCAATRTGAPPIVARATTTPSSSCGAMPQRARCGDGRGAASAASTGATLPGSAIAAMRSRGASGRRAVETTAMTKAQHMSPSPQNAYRRRASVFTPWPAAPPAP